MLARGTMRAPHLPHPRRAPGEAMIAESPGQYLLWCCTAACTLQRGVCAAKCNITWVVLPEPVSPTTTTTWFSRMTCSSSSRHPYTGRKRLCSDIVLFLAKSLAACTWQLHINTVCSQALLQGVTECSLQLYIGAGNPRNHVMRNLHSKAASLAASLQPKLAEAGCGAPLTS